MEISAALAADLDLLTDALNDPGVDIAETLRLMARDAKLAVRSYLGLSLTVFGEEQLISFTALDSAADEADIVSSLVLPLLSSPDGSRDDGRTVTPNPNVTLVLYAARPGAFVDLAADLAFLTGQGLDSFALDGHLNVPDSSGGLGKLRAASVINQAIGVLIGRGYAPEEAELELEARAEAAGTDRHVVAELILTFPHDDVLEGEADPS